MNDSPLSSCSSQAFPYILSLSFDKQFIARSRVLVIYNVIYFRTFWYMNIKWPRLNLFILPGALTSPVLFRIPASAPLSFPAPGCTYVTSEGLPTWYMLTSQLNILTMAVHDVIGQRASPQESARLEKLPRPNISPEHVQESGRVCDGPIDCLH